MDIGLFWSIIGSVAGVLAALASVLLAILGARAARRSEAAERQRLSSEVLGQPPAHASTGAPSDVPVDSTAGPTRPPVQGSNDSPKRTIDQVEVQLDQATQQQKHDDARDAVYDQLLINDYALGLTQARRAFNVSMSFSILGGIVLVLGVALAIFRADTGGQVAGAAITSGAGVLTSGLSQLFREQSTKALKHLENQATELRKDVRVQTNAGAAQRLLNEIADDELRGRLQAALILEFTGAKLPDFGKSSDLSLGALNGSVRSSESTEPSSASS